MGLLSLFKRKPKEVFEEKVEVKIDKTNFYRFDSVSGKRTFKNGDILEIDIRQAARNFDNTDVDDKLFISLYDKNGNILSSYSDYNWKLIVKTEDYVKFLLNSYVHDKKLNPNNDLINKDLAMIKAEEERKKIEMRKAAVNKSPEKANVELEEQKDEE